jgi:adenylate cyclase
MHVFSLPGGDPTLDQALSLAERSVALAPGMALTHARLGWVLQFLERPGKTVDAFERSIRPDPDNVEDNYSFGETLNRLARPAEALGYLNGAFELESSAPASWDWCRGHSHVLLKDYEKALDRIFPVLELVPGLVPAWVQLARLYAETGEMRQARLFVDRLRAALPNFGIDHAKRMIPYPSEIERNRLISGFKTAGLG